MIIAYRLENGGLARTDSLPEAVWIDLLQPSDEERARVAALVGVPVPSKDDQEEIEQSARLYLDGATAVMTAMLPAKSLTEDPIVEPVTFVLAAETLVTVRHHNPQSFDTFPQRAGRAQLGCRSALTALLGLMEEIVGRIADIAEFAGREIDAMSRAAFRTQTHTGRDMRKTLRAIGRKDGALMHLRESLLSLDRLLGFLSAALDHRKVDKDIVATLKSQSRDIRAISEQTDFLMQKTALLLDATLGLIGIEQNAIIKIFSVAAAAFLPPTLIASIYGMNFEAMPELSWRYGYPLAIVAMILSAVLPLLYFRRKGWL